MIIPEWLNLARYDHIALRHTHGIPGQDAVEWGELLGVAQAAMARGHSLSYPDANRLVGEPSLMVTAARIWDAASANPSGVQAEGRADLGLMATLAYGMYGNTPSARAIALRNALPERARDGIEQVALLTACPSLHAQILARVTDKFVNEYATVLNHFLVDGRAEDYAAAKSLIVSRLRAASLYHNLVLGFTLSCLEVLEKLSAARVLAQLPQVSAEYRRHLVESGVWTLLPPQREALLQEGLLSDQSNAIVTLPTSSGKTLLGELALVAALGSSENGVVCYVAPYVALGRQVLERMRRRRVPGVRLHPFMGGYAPTGGLDPTSHRELVVATPERFDSLLRNDTGFTRMLRCVVFDEAHVVTAGGRGVRVEGLIARLRLMQRQGSGPRIVLLSAVIHNQDRVRAWLGEGTKVVSSDWKPTARRLVLWDSRGRLQWLVGEDSLREEGQRSASIVGTSRFPPVHAISYSVDGFRHRRSKTLQVHENVAHLVAALWARYNHAILCVCATRGATRQLANALADFMPLLEPMPPRVQELASLLSERYGYLAALQNCLRYGVAYHNAALPHEIRQRIEDAAEAHELRVIVATTTLAEGVDLPFRFTVVANLMLWTGEDEEAMSALTFRNIAGRSGRAGAQTEGVTFVIDNPLDNFRAKTPGERRRLQLEIIARDQAPELTSALTVKALEEGTTERASLSAQFLASIPENPLVEDLVSSFADSTFRGQDEGSAALRTVLEQTRRDLLDEDAGALAQAASPLHLTPLGRSATATGLSPYSCRRLLAVLRSVDIGETNIGVIAQLLKVLIDLPEQPNARVAKKIVHHKGQYPVGNEDVAKVIEQWVAGVPVDEIFRDLPYVQRSKRQPPIDQWLSGGTLASTWDAEFEKVVDFVQGPVASFLPWLLRAAGQLAPHAERLELETFRWSQWADWVETGTDSDWAAAAVRRDAPASRAVVGLVGRLWPPYLMTHEDPLGLLAGRLAPSDVEMSFMRAMADVSADVVEEVTSVWQWWRDQSAPK